MAARFVARPNRFVILARRGDRVVRAASRDPGRLQELLTVGASLRLAPARAGSRRRTRYTVALVRRGRVWVSLVPALANDVLAAALARGGAPGLSHLRVAAREVRRGGSRFDLLLRGRGVTLLVEVKSATLVEDGLALFPDAPTVRGARHLRELTAHVRRGGRAAAVFVVQRKDASALSPNPRTDPAFALALSQARRAGVRLLAYTCRVGPRGVRLLRRIPVRTRGPGRSALPRR